MKYEGQPDCIEDGRLDKSTLIKHKDMTLETRSGHFVASDNIITSNLQIMFQSRPQSMMFMILMQRKLNHQLYISQQMYYFADDANKQAEFCYTSLPQYCPLCNIFDT